MVTSEGGSEDQVDLLVAEDQLVDRKPILQFAPPLFERLEALRQIGHAHLLPVDLEWASKPGADLPERSSFLDCGPQGLRVEAVAFGEPSAVNG